MHSNSDAVLQRLDQCICDVPCEMLTHVHVQSVTCFYRCVSDAKKGTLRLTSIFDAAAFWLYGYVFDAKK